MVTKQYTFAHPTSLTQHTDHGDLEMKKKGTPPIGVWQKLILSLFVVGMLGSAVFTIYGIQQMQPYIEH